MEDAADAALAPASAEHEHHEVPVAAVDGGDEPRFTVRLKMLDEQTFEVSATPSMSVTAFRAEVALVTQIPAPRQRLIYRGGWSYTCFAWRWRLRLVG